jgi:hypothetical protein
MIQLVFPHFFMVTLFGSFFGSPAAKPSPQVTGVEGYVYRVSGNQMPSPDRKPAKPRGISTTIYVFELTNINQVARLGQTAFYKAIKTKFIKKLDSGQNGHFSIQLPTGQYSFFTKKNELFYSNIFDSNNNIDPVTVFAGKMTGLEIRVDYDANY